MTGPWWRSMPSYNLDMPILEQMQVIDDNLLQYTQQACGRLILLTNGISFHNQSPIGYGVARVQGQITNVAASSLQSAHAQINYFAATEHKLLCKSRSTKQLWSL